uniref:Uncharacterized protein n=1 Tax=Arundo donax TaxID=35708 RepID=A0A0A9AWF7_ARUDO
MGNFLIKNYIYSREDSIAVIMRQLYMHI